MTYIKPIALAAALLTALTISFPAEAKSDTLSSAEEALEEGKVSNKDLDALFDRLKEAYRKGGKENSFDWKGMSSVILGEILKSDDIQKNKKLKDILDILTDGESKKEEPEVEETGPDRTIDAEVQPNDAIRRAVISSFDIPKKDWKTTKYSYNFMDLDHDGRMEALVLVQGPYTSGSGGDTLLILKEKDEGWEEDQAISIVHAPILVAAPGELDLPSDRKILILKRSGGGAKEAYVALTSHDGKYISVGEAEEIKDQEIHGTLLLVQKEEAPTLEEKEKIRE
ncbi:hypothetical protein [Dialister sp.]|uniref:hypothetical protein n=1 Tax=Dialister sp. TaxID=1955814 RepID=UPI003EFCBC9A